MVQNFSLVANAGMHKTAARLHSSKLRFGRGAPSNRSEHGTIIVLAAVVLGLWFISFVATSKWAFSRNAVAADLAKSTSGDVPFRSFRNLYFPHPGCVAEGITIQRKGSENPPLIAIAKLTIKGTTLGIFSKRVSLMQAEGLQVTPSGAGWPVNVSKSNIVIDRLVANNAALQIVHGDKNRPLSFSVHHFELENVGGNGPMPFRVEVMNPLPPGEISVSGKLGPWKTEQRDETPISGSYSFWHADLSAIAGVGGLLSSGGKFDGVIRQLHVWGETDTPQFEVLRTGHRFALKTQFDAQVNATNGDVILRGLDAELGDTILRGKGKIVPDAQHRRSTTLDFATQDGRIEDILYPFVKASRSPLNGVTNCRGYVILPGGKEPFLRKVALEANFRIEKARLSNPRKQEELSKASERARGNRSDNGSTNVLSNLKGHVALKNGVATFSQFSFAVPGARASMHGTYNLVNERINLHGAVRLQAKISDTSTGIKSFLLRAISTFIKRNKPQVPLPIEITGTFDHPRYSVSITKAGQHRQECRDHGCFVQNKTQAPADP